MEGNHSSGYDPEVLAKVSALKIQAMNLVEGLLTGPHRSRHKGSSIEFAEYKDYSPGDEIRHIDWKVVGKTDKYHVKQFEQSTNLKCTILLDASGSMAYESPESTATPKLEYARTLVASLACLLLKQFDAVGLEFNAIAPCGADSSRHVRLRIERGDAESGDPVPPGRGAGGHKSVTSDHAQCSGKNHAAPQSGIYLQ